MNEYNDIAYYVEREKQERDLAARAKDPEIAKIHLDMARQYENFPGWPSVVRSMPPGRTSSRLINASRSARPMAAVARSLLASALNVELAPISRRIGPLMMTRMLQRVRQMHAASRHQRLVSSRVKRTVSG